MNMAQWHISNVAAGTSSTSTPPKRRVHSGRTSEVPQTAEVRSPLFAVYSNTPVHCVDIFDLSFPPDHLEEWERSIPNPGRYVQPKPGEKKQKLQPEQQAVVVQVVVTAYFPAVYFLKLFSDCPCHIEPVYYDIIKYHRKEERYTHPQLP